MKIQPQLGIYIHWPYCARICPYCDFNVYKNRQIDAPRWRAALTRELEYWAAHTKGRKLTSLYFGGGTPSLAPLSVIEGVTDACERLWGFEDKPEITIESNPTDAEQERFETFAKAGVNRLSLGVQSLRDDALKFLGRDHNAMSARRAIETAQRVFDRVTFDLIYARPRQSIDEWRRELGEALATGATHLSLYQLTIEPGTAFSKAVERGAWAPVSDDDCADFYDLAQQMTAAAGLAAYEVSNHAAPGDQSRHNLIYWRYADYIGAGPGAHGRLTLDDRRIATETVERPDAYLQAVEETGTGAQTQDTLDENAQLTERLAMGLRLVEGIAFKKDDTFFEDDTRASRLQECIEDGLLIFDGARLCASDQGRRTLNAVLGYLLT